MPKIVDVDRTRRHRGRRRGYSTVEFIDQSLETGKGLYFTAEELQNEYGVKAQAFSSAVRKDAEALNRERTDGQEVKIFTRPYLRDEQHSSKTGDPILKDATSKLGYLEDLEIMAYLEAVTPDPDTSTDVEATEDGSDDQGEGKGKRK